MTHRSLLVLATILAACSPSYPGTPVAAAGVRFTAPPGWDARLAPPTTEAQHLLGWAANVPLDRACDPAVCAVPVASIADEAVLVSWFTYNCLPNCRLGDPGRTLIGGREATRETDAGTCALDAARVERIVVRVTPQRNDILVVCAGASASAGLRELDALLASINWTVP